DCVDKPRHAAHTRRVQWTDPTGPTCSWAWGTEWPIRERNAPMALTPRATKPRTSRARARVQANGQQSPPPPEPGLDLEITTITPELAQEWLDRGGTNRKITRRRIEAMTAAIQRGESPPTGEAIKLDDEGRARHGHNRTQP